MKKQPQLLIITILCFYLAVAHGKQVLSLVWVNGTELREQQSVAQLGIQFHDGSYDTITFDTSKQIAIGEEHPTCIRTGTFEKEPDVYVTLTGRCSNIKDYQMTIVGSKRLEHTMVKVTDGQAEYIESGAMRGSDLVEAIRAAYHQREASSGNIKFPRQGVRLGLNIHWKKEFKAYWESYKNPVPCVVESIVAHAQTYFKVPHSSSFYVYLDFLDGNLMDDSSKAIELDDLQQLAASKISSKGDVDIFFGLSSVVSTYADSYGKAFEGQVCSNRKQSAAVVLHKSTATGTGETLATMIAQLLGLRSPSKTSWTWKDMKKRYESGHLQCLPPYNCEDNDGCEFVFRCTSENEHKCPKKCGVCSLTPYPGDGLQLNLHMHYNEAFKNYWKKHHGKDVAGAMIELLDGPQSYFTSSTTLVRLYVKRLSEFTNPRKNAFHVQDLAAVKKLINTEDGCVADIFFGTEKSSDYYSADGWSLCGNRQDSVSIVLQNIWGAGAGTGRLVRDTLIRFFGMYKKDENFEVDNLKKLYEQGRFQCLEAIEE